MADHAALFARVDPAVVHLVQVTAHFYLCHMTLSDLLSGRLPAHIIHLQHATDVHHVPHSTESSLQDVMYTEEQIRERASQMATEIATHYRSILKPGEQLVVVGLLKGSLPFMHELVSRIPLNVVLDYIGVHSYAGTESCGSIDFKSDMEEDPKVKYTPRGRENATSVRVSASYRCCCRTG